MARRQFLTGCLKAAGVTACFALALGYCAYRQLRSESRFERYPSPDLRFDAVYEMWSSFLDGYGRVWITDSGDEDRSQWREIGPQVDGHWDIEWLAAEHLLLTDRGAWPEHRPPRDTSWRGVRI